MTQRIASQELVKDFTSNGDGRGRAADELQVEMRGTTNTFRRGIMKRSIAILLAVAVIALWSGSAYGFHDQGVAHCNGCHTMHNSQNGAIMADGGSPGNGVNSYLLQAATPSDTCLGCHAGDGGSYHVLASDPLVPTNERGAGDFVFLTEDNINDGHAGASNPILGYAAGHNINAPGHGITTDPVLATSPGGAFPSADLACSSCHDPHGTDSFRLLYGANRLVRTDGSTFVFNNAAPDATGLGLFFGVEGNANHTAYKAGMSAWCANCHGDFHNNVAALIHPSGTPLGNTIAAAYNAYNGTTDCVNNPPAAAGLPCGTGTQATAYLAQVPFEDPANTTTSTAGPTSSSRVMCLTCHRSHATSAPDAGRWDFSVTLLDEDGLESGSYVIPNPYDANQRSLCNKCHSKDEFDHLPFP